jgi:hypothetical protein
MTENHAYPDRSIDDGSTSIEVKGSKGPSGGTQPEPSDFLSLNTNELSGLAP